MCADYGEATGANGSIEQGWLKFVPGLAELTPRLAEKAS